MIRAVSFLTFVALSLCACSTASARDDHGEFLSRELIFAGKVHRYQVFVPARSAGDEHPAVILFLHGSGERGVDNQTQLDAGLGPYVREHRDDFPAIVVFPQVPSDGQWIGASLKIALAAMEAATAEFRGDAQRVYLTGISMGGIGAWELALMEPGRFAAVVPIACAVTQLNPDRAPYIGPVIRAPDPYAALAARMKHVPMWIFHGTKDDTVSPDDDRKMHAALKAAGANVRYTEFADASHNAWDPAYATPELWTWLLAQKRR
jgi:predicted peptidase